MIAEQMETFYEYSAQLSVMHANLDRINSFQNMINKIYLIVANQLNQIE